MHCFAKCQLVKLSRLWYWVMYLSRMILCVFNFQTCLFAERGISELLRKWSCTKCACEPKIWWREVAYSQKCLKTEWWRLDRESVSYSYIFRSGHSSYYSYRSENRLWDSRHPQQNESKLWMRPNWFFPTEIASFFWGVGDHHLRPYKSCFSVVGRNWKNWKVFCWTLGFVQVPNPIVTIICIVVKLLDLFNPMITLTLEVLTFEDLPPSVARGMKVDERLRAVDHAIELLQNDLEAPEGVWVLGQLQLTTNFFMGDEFTKNFIGNTSWLMRVQQGYRVKWSTARSPASIKA